jgi:putative FmdB family regulatory protein
VCDNGHRFELIRKFSDPPLEKCPTCGAPVRKLQSAPAIQFKGSGFYITDYKNKGMAKAASAESGASAPKADAGAKAEAPAAKPAAAAGDSPKKK